jgi:hypothetical protein
VFVVLFLFALPLVLLVLAVVLVVVVSSAVSSLRRRGRQEQQVSTHPSGVQSTPSRPALTISARFEGWPMPDADPRASRRSRSAGARKGKVAWTWTPPMENPEVHEPLVPTDCGAIVVPAQGSGRHVLGILSPQGTLQREILLPHPPWSQPYLGEDTTIFASAWEVLLALSLEGEIRWQRKLPGNIRHLRRTPAGKLLAFTKEKGFVSFESDGKEGGPVYPELGSWDGELRLAFDESGTLYVAEKNHWRSSEDDSIEEYRRIAAFDPRGQQLWLRNLTAPCAYDDPEYTVAHIRGLADSAVFFGDRKIESYDARGRLLWEIAGPHDFERTVKIAPLELFLGWDSRLLGAPRLVAVSGRCWEYLESAVDGQGNIYFFQPHAVVSLDAEFRLRWTVELPEVHLYDPVIGPHETFLVHSFGTLHALE